MKKGWEYKALGECAIKVQKQKQVKSKDYKETGKYPIVSQEKELISGYGDDESYLYRHIKPIIVFGDHTKEVKLYDEYRKIKNQTKKENAPDFCKYDYEDYYDMNGDLYESEDEVYDLFEEYCW